MNTPTTIITYLDTMNAGTSRHGTATVDELEKALGIDYETLSEALAVLMLRKQIILRGILKKRILVVRTKGLET